MTSKTKPETLIDAELANVQGGANYVKLTDIEGMVKDSYELAGKQTAREIATK